MSKNPILLAINFLAGCLIAVACASPCFAYPEYTRNPEISETVKVPVAKWWDSAIPEKGIILAVHGLTLCGDSFDVTARELTQRGYTVYAFDMRGFGRWKEEAEKFNDSGRVNYEFIRQDLIGVSKALREKFPESKLYLMGESLGANLSAWLVSQRPELADGLILSALCYKTRFHPRWRWIADVPSGFIWPNAPMKLTPYVKPSLSTDPTVTETYLKDPSISHELSIVTLVKGQLTNRLSLKEIEKIPENMPILILSGENDRLFKTKSVNEVIKRMGSKRVDFRILAGTGHLILECQKPGGDISKVIAQWIEKSEQDAQVSQTVHDAVGDKQAKDTDKAPNEKQDSASSKRTKTENKKAKLEAKRAEREAKLEAKRADKEAKLISKDAKKAEKATKLSSKDAKKAEKATKLSSKDAKKAGKEAKLTTAKAQDAR